MKLKHFLALGLIAAVIFPAAYGISVSANTVQTTASRTASSALTQNTLIDEGTYTGEEGTINWKFYEDGTLLVDGTGATPNWWPWYDYKDEIKTIIVEEGITTLGAGGFMNHPNLTTVTIEGKLNSVSPCAFEDCSQLKSITFSKGVSTIETSAFKDCKSLSEINISKGSTAFGSHVFSGCDNLSTINITEGVSNVDEFAFMNCKLSNITFSDSATTIGKGAFYGCKSLTTVKLPQNLTVINDDTFHDCINLTSITIPEKVNEIGNQAFLRCNKLKNIKFPATLKTIGKLAFTECGSLESIEIPASITNIVNQAFINCARLSTVTISKGATNISSNVFKGCTDLLTIRYTGTQDEWNNLNIELPDVLTAQVLQQVYYNYTPNHKHNYVDYTIGGKPYSRCSVCGDWKINSTPTPSPSGEKEHKWSSWKTISAATVFKGAVLKRTCSTCGKSETKTGSKLKPTIQVNATSFPLKINQKTTAFKVGGFAKGDSVASWKSSNTKIVKVSGNANGTNKIIAGKKTGKAVITITLKSGLTKKISVTVQKKAVTAKKITGIPKKLNLKAKKKSVLKPVLNPITCTDKVTYKTSNKKIATVNGKGQISTKKKGTAVITVRAGRKTVKCKITVK